MPEQISQFETPVGPAFVQEQAPADTAFTPAPGAHVGQYELIRELGRGGMGMVYLARDTQLGRRVAMKFLHSDVPEVSARFLLEARATARCSHENIVIIYEVGEIGDTPFMALEYLEGAPLSHHLRQAISRAGCMTPSRAVQLMVPVVSALVCAHEHNIVHRDLKPDNIFVTDRGVVKVLDFGIAKLVEPRQRAELRELRRGMDQVHAGNIHLTQQGALVGTMPYMSPEQWRGEPVDHLSDLWTVGVMLYEMLAGHRPLRDASGMQLMVTGTLHEPMPRMHDARADIPDALAEVVDRCLRKPAEERFASAAELLAALELLLPGRHHRAVHRDQCPYAGLRPFQESDAGRFFGREGDVVAAVNRLRQQPLLAVVGPSGVGKSSFVRAGLIPALKTSGESWEALILRPGRAPLQSLAHVAMPMLQTPTQHSGDSGSRTMAADLDQLAHVNQQLSREPGFFAALLRRHAQRRDVHLMVFVDQFEETYTHVMSDDERAAFLACLVSIADDPASPLRLVLSLRADYLHHCASDEAFMNELSRGLLFLMPPGRSGLADALRQPADMAGYAFETDEIIDDMLDHLQHAPGALPLLQFAASRLWDLRDRGRRLLCMASYRQIGGVAGALASHADHVVQELPPVLQEQTRTLFLRLVTSERTRAVVPLSELVGLGADDGAQRDIRRLIDHLAAARLLVVQTNDGVSSVEIVHESLLSGDSWPRLSKWLDDDHYNLAFLGQLRTVAGQWHQRGRPPGLLWRGRPMEEARTWYRSYRGPLTEIETDYMAAVLALANRGRRVRGYVLGTVMVALVVLSASATAALLRIQAAEQDARQQADFAQQAEVELRRQYVRLDEQNKELDSSNDQLTRTISERDELNEVQKQTYDALQAAYGERERINDQLLQQNRRLKRLLRRARRAENLAESERTRALAAMGELEQAMEENNSHLAAANRRIQDLQRVIGVGLYDGDVRETLVDDLDISSAPDDEPDSAPDRAPDQVPVDGAELEINLETNPEER